MSVDHDSLMRCHRQVLQALSAEMCNRSRYRGLEWIETERRALANAANVYALAHGLNTITVSDIAKFEHLAVGHVDYATKIALYVAEFTHGARTVKP